MVTYILTDQTETAAAHITLYKNDVFLCKVTKTDLCYGREYNHTLFTLAAYIVAAVDAMLFNVHSGRLNKRSNNFINNNRQAA